MVIEQIHFPQNEPNWNKILVGAIVLISVCAIVYVAIKPTNASKFRPKPKDDDIA